MQQLTTLLVPKNFFFIILQLSFNFKFIFDDLFVSFMDIYIACGLNYLFIIIRMTNFFFKVKWTHSQHSSVSIIRDYKLTSKGCVMCLKIVGKIELLNEIHIFEKNLKLCHFSTLSCSTVLFLSYLELSLAKK